MLEKKCGKCGVVKPLDEFHKHKKLKDGRQYNCKECRKEHKKQHYQNNKESILEKQSQYYYDNRESILEKQKEYKKQYRQDNKEEIRKQQAQWYQGNKEEIRKQQKQYAQDNKEKRNERDRNRRANDPVAALRENVSVAIRKALKRNDGSKKGESVLQYLPYTIEQLQEHLEKQFKPGMSWDNHSLDGWHIDHIYPHSKLPYDSMDHPNFLKCWALDNLQPLWAEENISKGAKIIND
tara:strand:- start:690 stop:1400 length:711 start_codon:yes stop_codon:yes gene_type:complete